MLLVERNGFESLFEALKQKGYTVIGPTIRDQAIIYDEISSCDDLPAGWTDEQDAGTYRLKQRNDNALFGYVVGPTSWKKFLYPPKSKLWNSERDGKDFKIVKDTEEVPHYAFLGVRSCELSAIAIQDKVFLEGNYVDPIYKARRENSLLIAVNCGQAAKTCFCTSMNTGPEALSGFDIVLTEIIDNNHHYFVVDVGSDAGKQIINSVPSREASYDEIEASKKAVRNASDQISRHLNTDGIKELLYDNIDNPQWDKIAKKCVSCANCTMSCPTCFCSTVEDVTDLTGDNAQRWRMWDSCFTMDFSYIHGGPIRPTTKSRYRQWIMHKLASWQDQFGTSGCVGCGRCITWCPVGIDITEQAQQIRANQRKSE